MTDQEARKLIEAAKKVVSYRPSMSYNDSYFGEPEGAFKQRVTELERSIPPAMYSSPDHPMTNSTSISTGIETMTAEQMVSSMKKTIQALESPGAAFLRSKGLDPTTWMLLVPPSCPDPGNDPCIQVHKWIVIPIAVNLQNAGLSPLTEDEQRKYGRQ